MNNSTRKKKEQLGINPATASAILKKKLLFSLAQRLHEDICYQCAKKIETIEEFSIEHKTPWLDSDDPVGLFFDLDNIAFSHLSCNIREAKREKAKCGTARSYQNGCRCNKCIQANTKKVRIFRNKYK